MHPIKKRRIFSNILIELANLSRLAIPILIAQITLTAMAFVDTVMAGNISATDMAAVSVASSFWLPIILLIQGLLLALTPIIAQLHGAKKHQEIPNYIWQGGWIALIAVLFAALLLYLSPLVMEHMAVDIALERLTRGYLVAVLPALPAFALFQVLKNFVEGLSNTLPTMVIGFIGLLINIPANYIFINGLFGMPALGAIGCGVATTLVYWGMLIAMACYLLLSPRYRSFKLFSHFQPPHKQKIYKIVKLGTPIALAFFFEVSLFSIVALLLAPLGATVVASHQIAINYTTLIFMIPLSIAMAVTIRTGYLLGEQRPELARLSGLTGIGCGLGIAAITSIFTLHYQAEIARFYSADIKVITGALQLLTLAAAYQLSDAIQVISAGALRGYKDTGAIFIITLCAFWFVGLPVGIILSSTHLILAPMGAPGFWIGFIVGLTTAAILLAYRLHTIYRTQGAA